VRLAAQDPTWVQFHSVTFLSNSAAACGVYCHATAAQPEKQQGKRCLKQGLPDISQLNPELQQEWHPDNNALLDGIKVKPYSNVRVMWSCPNCPAGCPHIWKASVHSRTRGTKCPYCQGHAVPLVRMSAQLATRAPRQTQYWNHDKNAKTPEQMLAGSNLRAEWKCPKCSYEWQAPVAHRVQHDSGCPRCRNKALGRNTKQPTFEAAQHQLLREWDYERNAADGIHPNNTTLGSNKLVHWDCQKCQGQLHRFQMRAHHRTGKHSSGCPYCAGQQACECNSLQAHYPVISSEWDFGMNDKTPADVTSRYVQNITCHKMQIAP